MPLTKGPLLACHYMEYVIKVWEREGNPEIFSHIGSGRQNTVLRSDLLVPLSTCMMFHSEHLCLQGCLTRWSVLSPSRWDSAPHFESEDKTVYKWECCRSKCVQNCCFPKQIHIQIKTCSSWIFYWLEDLDVHIVHQSFEQELKK